MRISNTLMGLAASTILIAGCASQEVPATQAVTAVELSLSEVRVDAAKFAPAELNSAETKLAKIKGELANEKYKDVLADSSELTKEVALLKEVVVSKQTQFAAATNE